MSFISFDFEEKIQSLDPHDPGVVAALLQAFLGPVAALIETVTENPATGQTKMIAEIFSGVLDGLPEYSSGEAPSFQAWLYRIAWRQLVESQSRNRRLNLQAAMPALLAGSPYALNVIEIAFVLKRRESQVAKHVPEAGFQEETGTTFHLPEVDHDTVLSLITARKPAGNNSPSSRFQLFGHWRELGLLFLVALAVLGALKLSTRSLPAGSGPALFPTSTPQLPAVMQVEATRVVYAPDMEMQAANIFIQNVEPVLSDDGRFVAFSSNSPALAPGGTDESLQIFVYDILGRALELASVSSEGVPGDGFSYGGDISSDGRFVVFASSSTNLVPGTSEFCARQEFWGGCAHIFRHDRLSGETILVSTSSDGRPLEYPSALPAISGDGSVVVFWSFRALGAEDSCRSDFDEEIICADLLIKELESGLTHKMPVGKSYFDFTARLSIGGPMDLVGLPLFKNDELFARLDSPNNSEAILYDWRSDAITLLNLAPGGSPGNGDSYLPVISRDGSTAIFISKAGNLVEDDSNGLMDVFSYDLSSGHVQAASVTGGGVTGDGESGAAVQPDWNTRIHVSANGRYSIFISSADDLIDTQSGVWCGEIGGQFWDCYALLVHDRELGTTDQIVITSQTKFGPGSQFYYPTISADGRFASFMAVETEFGFCAPNGCSNIWVKDRTSGDFTLASPDTRLASQKGPWRFEASLQGHNGWTNSVAYASNGMLVTGGQDGRVQVFDSSFQLSQDLRDHAHAVNTVAVSPDGQYLASGSVDGSLVIWDFTDGSTLYSLDGQSGLIFDMAFSPDGSSLAVGAQKALVLFEVRDGQFFRSQELPQPDVRAVAYTPDSRFIAAVSGDEIWLRDVRDGGVLSRVGGHSRKLQDIAFSPNGDLLATASEDGNVNLWSMKETGEGLDPSYLFTLHHADWVHALAFSPTEEILATGSFDSAIHFWSTVDGSYLDTLHRSSQDQVLSLAYSPDGLHLAAGTVRGIRLWSRGENDALAGRESAFFLRLGSDSYLEPATNLPLGLRGFSEPVEISGNLQAAPELAPLDYFRLTDPDGKLTLSSIAFFRRANAGFNGVVQVYLYSTSYQPAVITLVQAESNPINFDVPIGLTAQVQKVPLGEGIGDGELVLGGWSFGASALVNEQFSATDRTWSDEAASFWLRWKQDGLYYSLYFDQSFNSQFVVDSEKLTLETFLEIAAGIIESGP